jgi:hypothetical protein
VHRKLSFVGQAGRKLSSLVTSIFTSYMARRGWAPRLKKLRVAGVLVPLNADPCAYVLSVAAPFSPFSLRSVQFQASPLSFFVFVHRLANIIANYLEKTAADS